jgi:hypothetical protein
MSEEVYNYSSKSKGTKGIEKKLTSLRDGEGIETS